MTVQNDSNVKTYTGNGVTTVFPYDFFIPGDTATDQTNVQVTLLTIATGLESDPLNTALWSITGVGSESYGNVTYTGGGTPLPATHKINIRRVLPYEQNLDLTTQSAYFPELLEEQLDLMVFQTQQLAEEVGRAVKVAVGSTDNPATIIDSLRDAATDAAASASSASGSASAAATSETNAAASAALAEKWATENEDVAVSGGLFSAKHWAAKAAAAVASVSIAVAADIWSKVSSKLISVTAMWGSAAEVTVTYGSSVALDFNTFINAKITLTGNITLAQPTNLSVGQSGCIRLIQDATGSRTVAFHADYKFAGGTDPAASTAANSVDLLYYHVVAANFVHASLNKAIS